MRGQLQFLDEAFMRSVFFQLLFFLILSASNSLPYAVAAPGDSAPLDSIIERAKSCVRAGMNDDLVFHEVVIEQDLFEVRIVLVTCDEEYFWYEGVCGHTEERHVVVFSRTDGSLLRGPKGCASGI